MIQTTQDVPAREAQPIRELLGRLGRGLRT
jgi:hypothetical protein